MVNRQVCCSNAVRHTAFCVELCSGSQEACCWPRSVIAMRAALEGAETWFEWEVMSTGRCHFSEVVEPLGTCPPVPQLLNLCAAPAGD